MCECLLDIVWDIKFMLSPSDRLYCPWASVLSFTSTCWVPKYVIELNSRSDAIWGLNTSLYCELTASRKRGTLYFHVKFQFRCEFRVYCKSKSNPFFSSLNWNSNLLFSNSNFMSHFLPSQVRGGPSARQRPGRGQEAHPGIWGAKRQTKMDSWALRSGQDAKQGSHNAVDARQPPGHRRLWSGYVTRLLMFCCLNR